MGGLANRLGPRPSVYATVAGGTLLAAGLGMLLAGIAGDIRDGETAIELIAPGAVTALIGAVALVLKGEIRSDYPLRPLDGFTAVTLAWLAAAVAGSIPFLLAGVFSSPLDALFEAMSGFTTTGATLINDVDGQSSGILLWRSLSQWIGGVGIVVLVVAIAPISGPSLQRAFYAEFSGVASDRLTPRITDTAKIVAGIYLLLTLAAALAYLLAGMGAFDAINHSMTTLATGGFSTLDASIGGFDSLPIELVAVSFMIIAGVNFAFYWRAVRGGSLMPQAAEVRAYLIILAVAIVGITITLVAYDDFQGGTEAFRAALFDVTSIMTGTGYTTADFDSWNELARIGMLFLMFIGGCAGSTSGGMKVSRVILLAKTAKQEIERQSQPSAVQVLRLGGRSFPEEVRRAVLAFFLLYMIIFGFGVLAFAASGLEPASALGAATASLNIIGPGIGDVGAANNFGAVPPAGRVVAIVLMLTGRLEIFTVVALLAYFFRTRGVRR